MHKVVIERWFYSFTLSVGILQDSSYKTREMVLCVKALATKVEELSLFPRTHVEKGYNRFPSCL